MADKESGKKSWKDALLASSLPLEYSVIELIRSLGGDASTPFSYDRLNEQGVRTTFSVDVRGGIECGDGKTRLDLLVECKYRHQSTKWIFIPDSSVSFDGRVGATNPFTAIDLLAKDYRFNYGLGFHPPTTDTVACGMGIELYANSDRNPKTIVQSIRQLQYAVVARIDQVLQEFLLNRAFGNPNRLSVLVPIVVTTAQLWQLVPGTTVEAVESAQRLEDVAKTVDWLLVHDRPGADVIRFRRERLVDGLSPKQIESINESMRGRLMGDYALWASFGPFPGFGLWSFTFVLSYASAKARLNEIVDTLNQLAALVATPGQKVADR